MIMIKNIMMMMVLEYFDGKIHLLKSLFEIQKKILKQCLGELFCVWKKLVLLQFVGGNFFSIVPNATTIPTVTTTTTVITVTTIIVKDQMLLLYSSKGTLFRKVLWSSDRPTNQPTNQLTIRIQELLRAAKKK